MEGERWGSGAREGSTKCAILAHNPLLPAIVKKQSMTSRWLGGVFLGVGRLSGRGGPKGGLKKRQASHMFGRMKRITKRELVRNPALASHLRPVESIQLEDGKEPLVILRRKKRTLTAEDIHTELDRICKGAPEIDTLAVLNDLRE